MGKVNSFYVRSSLYVVLSLISAITTYFLYPILSRILTIVEFGDFVTITGLSNQVLGVLMAFSIISIALVKQYGEQDAHDKARVIQKVLFWLFLGVTALALILSPLLLDVLHIQYAASFLVLALIMVLAVPTNIWTGYLQAHKEHVRTGIFGVGAAVLKLLCAAGLAATYGIAGGLWGFLLGSLLGLIVLYYLPGRPVPKLDTLFSRIKSSEKAFLRAYGSYMVQAVFVVAGLVFLQNYDLNLVKAVFSPEVAGVYSGVSVLSNAVYYVAFLLIWVLLPEFSISNPQNNRRILGTAYRLIALLTVATIIGGLSLGAWVLGLLLGDGFAGQSTTFTVAILYRITLAAITLYAFYLLVLRKRRSILLSGLVLVSCLIVPLWFTNSPFEVVTSLLASSLLGVLLYLVVSRFMPPKSADD